MLSKTLAFFALASSYALAAPSPVPQAPQFEVPSFGDKMGVAATGGSIVNKDLTASEGRIFIGGTQTPSCDGGARQDFATFVLYSDGSTYLYKLGNPPQQLWVDASGMGGGISGFTTGAQPAPKNASREKFAVDAEGYLTFNGVGAKACPTQEQDKYSVWFTTNEKPGFQEGCIDVQLKAYKAPARVACEYTSAP